MTTPTKTPSGGAPTKSEREWLRTFMHMIRVSPSLVREPDLIDRQVNKKYNLGLDLDRPKDPTETQRVASKMFCSSVTPQRFAFFMRDDELRAEMRDLLTEVPLFEGYFKMRTLPSLPSSTQTPRRSA